MKRAITDDHQLELIPQTPIPPPHLKTTPIPPPSPVATSPDVPFGDILAAFTFNGAPTICTESIGKSFQGEVIRVPAYVNEFWTARQRQGNSLHEISYRACFKPQLPRFFIERLTQPGEIVHDPFMGRGTTLIEAALLGRIPSGCDINPLSIRLARPRIHPPSLDQIKTRLATIDFQAADPASTSEDLLVFYHPETLREISALRRYLLERQTAGTLDAVDEWIFMVALNRLTGHSNGFFSVYTLPPNQAVSVKSQRRINERRNQIPERRDVPSIILKKSRILLSECDATLRTTLASVAPRSQLLAAPASATPSIPDGSVSLVVTSPPFLDIVQYATDNWLRGWFAGIDPSTVKITMSTKVAEWQTEMTAVFKELARILRPLGHVAFEVGEVRNNSIRLEEAVLPCGLAAGLKPILVMINAQEFTKTANCWGVDNNSSGTNTNRIVLFQKPNPRQPRHPLNDPR